MVPLTVGHDRRFDADSSSTVLRTMWTNDHEPQPSMRITTTSHKLGLHSMHRNGRIVQPRSHYQEFFIIFHQQRLDPNITTKTLQY